MTPCLRTSLKCIIVVLLQGLQAADTFRLNQRKLRVSIEDIDALQEARQ